MDIFSKTSQFPKKHHRCISLESGQTLTKKSYPKTPLDLPRFYPRRYSTPELAMRKHALKYQRDDSRNEQPISNKSCQTDILGLDKYLHRSPPGDANLNSTGHSAVLRTYKKPTKKPKVRSVGVHCERRRMTFAAFKGCQKFKHVYKRKISLPQPSSTATSTDDGRRDSSVLPKLRPDRTETERPVAAKAIPAVKLPRIPTRDAKPEPDRMDDCAGGGTKLARLIRPQSTGSSGGGGSSSGADRTLAYFRASSAPKIDSRYYTLIAAPQPPPSEREQTSTAGSSDTADTTLDMSFVRRQSREDAAAAATAASTTAGTSSTTRTVSTSTTFAEPVFPIVFSCESVLRHPLDGGYVSHTESHRFSVHYVPVEDAKAVTTDDTDDGSRSSLVFTSAGACQNERCLTGDSICVTLGGGKPTDDSAAVSRYEPSAPNVVVGERRLYVERSNADVLRLDTTGGTAAHGGQPIVGQRPVADHWRSSMTDGRPLDKTTDIMTVTTRDAGDQRTAYGGQECSGVVKTMGLHVLGKGDGVDGDVNTFEKTATEPSMPANKTIDDFGEDYGGAEDDTALESHHAHAYDMPFQSDERNYERLTQNNQIVDSDRTVSNQSPKFDGTATRLGTIDRHDDLAEPVEDDAAHASELNAPRANVELTEQSNIAADTVAAVKDRYDDEPTRRIQIDDNNRLAEDDLSHRPCDNVTVMSPPHGRKLQHCDSTAKHGTAMNRRSSCENTNRPIARPSNQHGEYSNSSHRRNVPVRLNDHMSRKRNDDGGDGDSKDCREELLTDRNSHPKQHADQHSHTQQHADRHPHAQQHADQHPHLQQHVDRHPHAQQHADQHPHPQQHADRHPHAQQHADQNPHPQQHVDRHPHAQQHADQHPHSQQHVDRHPHPQQHVDRHPNLQKHGGGHSHSQQHADRHAHAQKHADRHSHPQQHVDRNPHPQQHTNQHPHPQQHADRHPHPQQHVDRNPHPQQHTNQHPHSQQHADRHPHPQQHVDRNPHPQQHTNQHPHPQQHADRHPHPQQHFDRHPNPQQHVDRHFYPHVEHNSHSQHATRSDKTTAAPHSNTAGRNHHEPADVHSHRHGVAIDQHHRPRPFGNRADETGGKRLLQRSKSTLHVRAEDEDRYNSKANKSAESGDRDHHHHHEVSTQRGASNDKNQHSTYRRKLESVDETMESKESNYVGGFLFGDAYYKKQPQKYDSERHDDSKKVNFSSKPNFEYYHDYVPGTVHSPRDEDCTVFAEVPQNSDDYKNKGHAQNNHLHHHRYSTTGTAASAAGAAAQASYYSQLDKSYGDDKNTDSDESLTDSLEDGCKYEGAAVSYFLALNGQKSAVTFTLKMPNTLESRLNRRHSQLKKHLHVSTTVRKTSTRIRTRHKSCQTLWTEEKGVQVQRGSTANANRKPSDDHRVLETLLAGMARHHVSENQIRVVGGQKLVSEGNQTERMPEPPTDRQTQTTRDAAAGPETPNNSATGGQNKMKKFSSDNALMVGVVRQNKYKGKEAVDGAKNDQLLTLSKGWINFYTLRADSTDCTDAQELHDNDDEIKTEDDSQQYTVHVQAIPEPVTLPVVHVPNRNALQLTKTCSTVKHLPKLVQTENNNHHCAPPLATATANGWCVSVDGPNNMHMKVSLLPDKLDNKTSEHFDHNEENKLESRRLALQRKNNYMRKPYRNMKRTQSTPRDMFSADVSRTESALSAESKYIETIDTQLLIHKARRRLSQEWDTRIQNGGVTESVQLVVTGDSVSSRTSQHYANRGNPHCSFRRQSRRI